MQTKTISFINQQFLEKEENKIKFLESRLNSPNNIGKSPAEYIPLKENEIQNIKTQMIILPPTKILTNFTNKNKISPLKNKKNITEVKIEMFLNKKRKLSAPKEILDDGNKDPNLNYSINDSNKSRLSDKSSNTKNTKDENNSALFSGKNISNNNYLFSKKDKNKFEFKFNKKNENKQINNNFNEYLNNKNNNALKTKTIYDYYKTTSIKTSYSNKNNNKQNISNNNISSNINKIDLINANNNINIEKLLKKLEDQNIIVEQRDKEISKLKLCQKENEEIILELKQYQKDSEIEIKRCRLDISNMVKEISNLQRESKRKWLNEQQYYIGKISTTHTIHYNKSHLIEYWEDGKDFIEIKNKLEKIKSDKEEIIKLKDSEKEDNSLNIFKLNILEEEEKELNQKLNEIEKIKFIYIREQNLLNQESRCTFAPHKKEGLPLLSGRYQIVGLIGKGGYSEVYKAYDLEDHIYVACKLNHLNQNWKEEVQNSYIKHTIRENQIHKNINHPNIVKLFDTIEIDNDSFCTILEYCSGPDLSTYIKKNKYIPEKEAKIIISQILEGLIYLNNLPNKIIHYDLKPENIIFNNMEIKISDFGLSKIIERNSDKVQLTSQGVGTYWYLPPECFEEKKNINISSKVDIWSCGVILYEMIYNKKPFGHNCSQDKLLKDKIIQNAKIVEFPEKPYITEECKDFIRHCLAFRQEDRYDVFQAKNSNFIVKVDN